MPNGALVDMAGQRIGKLTVVGRGDDYVLRNGKRRPRWWCLCDCGNRVLRIGQNIRRSNPENASCGCLQRDLMASVGRGNHKGNDITYNTAHKRVRWARGRARDHACVDCGNRANEWSYDHSDPNEMTQMVRRRDRRTPMTYSADVNRYQPRCHECHAQFDGRR